MRARAFIMPARMFQTRQKLTTPGSGERRDGRGSGMSKVFEVARREFVATVFTKAFIIGLLVLPAMIAFFVLIGPRLFNADGFTVEGELAVIDATGEVMPDLRAGLTEGTDTADVFELIRRTRAEAAGGSVAEALAAKPRLDLVELPPGDIDEAKAWLIAPMPETRRLALAVIHDDAVRPRAGETSLGSFDLYVPPGQDQRAEIAIQQVLREAIVAARMRDAGLDRARINELTTIPRVRSITVTDEEERETVGALNAMLPFAFMFLLIMSVMGSGQGLLTTMIEEKSSRVVEVLLSAVSPMQLMAGKLLGHMAVSLLAMSLYVGLGVLTLTSFSLMGLLDPSLIAWLLLFFLIAFFTIGSLMMAAGAAVNDMREAQSLMTPLMLVLILPWFLWIPISRDPSSTLSVIASFVPPINTFGMLMRMASTEPPPLWQVWASVAIGVVGVVAAIWFAAKVFRIGILMFGRPPDLKTLVRWVRAA